ncbi:MAG: MFS transporter [Bdellovibrionaceae bacterium]|nr:MFS transporter [Pseudobdellovibrionaceae bacterium]MDW8189649.1 MFS transporter [Pseudobdellovibrionaceae bacterium]
MLSKQNKTHLTIIFITIFLYLLGFGVLIPVMPIIAQEFGASPLLVGLLMSTYSLMQFLFAPFWGRISDHHGRRPTLLLCLIGEGISYILFAVSQNLFGLFLARILSGFFGGSLSTASASISDVTGEKDRSKGMALIGTAFSLGFLFGPALGGLFSLAADHFFPDLGPTFGLRFAAIIVAIMCFLTFAFAYFRLKETIHLKKESKSSMSIGTLTELSRWQLFGRFLKKPITGVLIQNFFLNSFAMSMMEASLVLFVRDRFDWGVKEVSFGFSYLGLIGAINQGIIARKLLPIFGEKILLPAGMLIQITGYLMVAFATSVGWLAFALTILSIGNSLVSPSLLGAISLTTAESEQGESLGTAQSMSSLGRIMGPALGGLIYQMIASPAPFVTSAAIVALSWIVLHRIRNDIPNSAKVGNTDASEENDFDRIGSFQFNNLIYNRVPFILLSDQTHFEEVFQELELSHIRNILVVVDFQAPENQWVAKVKEKAFPETYPLVILRSDGPISVKSVQRLKKLYRGNICVVNQSWYALKKDLLSQEF